MKKLTFKIFAVLVMEDGSSETSSFIQTNTSMIGAIKEVERIAERAGVQKVRIIRCIDLGF